jgi:predicted RNA-binding protein (virulence factor B family)
MIKAGSYYKLKIVKFVEFGAYLDADGEEILLPKRYVPKHAEEGDEIEVFIYHDSDNRLIATTEKPHAIVGEVALLKVVDTTDQGAFLSWGIMKDLFVPVSQQLSTMFKGESYLVMPYVDEQTGRVAATEKVQQYLSNDVLTVEEKEPVDLIVWRKSDIGYNVIINNKHTGVLHFSDVVTEPQYGDRLKGYIKTIREENKIDVAIGERGYKRVLSETDRLLELLDDNNGYLPFNDKSDPNKIYEFFGISKKAFKMATGALYKQKKIEFTSTGIKKIEDA